MTYKQKIIFPILALVITVTIIIFLSTTTHLIELPMNLDNIIKNVKMSEKYPELTQKEYEEIKLKAELLLDLHNKIVLDFENKKGDPLDYGFDLDIGWTNIELKRNWCSNNNEHIEKNQAFGNKLDSILTELEKNPNKPPALIERMNEDYGLLEHVNNKMAEYSKQRYDFKCNFKNILWK